MLGQKCTRIRRKHELLASIDSVHCGYVIKQIITFTLLALAYWDLCLMFKKKKKNVSISLLVFVHPISSSY